MKYSRVYENGIEKHIINFGGKEFDYSMVESSYGKQGDKSGFVCQINEKFPQLTEDELEEAGAGDIWCGDLEEIFECMESLEILEQKLLHQ